MTGELYEYIVSILAVGIIFVSGVLAIPTISYVNTSHLDEQQLRNTALNVFNAILLGPGSPPYWGSVYPFNSESVELFGLAHAGQSSLYVIDQDKLQRLDRDSPGFITYEEAKEKLHLDGYDFTLEIIRPFTVDALAGVSQEGNDQVRVWFRVNVTRNEDGRPIPNTQIKRIIIVSAQTSSHDLPPIAKVTSPKTFFTNAIGKLETDEVVSIPSDYSVTDALVILEVSVAGMSTIVVARDERETFQDFVKIYTFGDTISLKVRNEFLDKGGGERRIKSIDSYKINSSLMQIFDGSGANPTNLKVTPGSGYETWDMEFPGLKATNPMLLLFTLSVVIPPRRLVIIAGPFSFGDPTKVFSFGPDSGQSSDVSLKLRRYIVFSGMTYIAELTLWKE